MPDIDQLQEICIFLKLSAEAGHVAKKKRLQLQTNTGFNQNGDEIGNRSAPPGRTRRDETIERLNAVFNEPDVTNVNFTAMS